jgi:hypothetical protein
VSGSDRPLQPAARASAPRPARSKNRLRDVSEGIPTSPAEVGKSLVWASRGGRCGFPGTVTENGTRAGVRLPVSPPRVPPSGGPAGPPRRSRVDVPDGPLGPGGRLAEPDGRERPERRRRAHRPVGRDVYHTAGEPGGSVGSGAEQVHRRRRRGVVPVEHGRRVRRRDGRQETLGRVQPSSDPAMPTRGPYASADRNRRRSDGPCVAAGARGPDPSGSGFSRPEPTPVAVRGRRRSRSRRRRSRASRR